MKRLYTKIIEEHLRENRQMLFLMGPRQVGKTTTSLAVKDIWGDGFYYNWDKLSDRKKILEGADQIAADIGLHGLKEKPPLVIFDELHKYPRWKNFLKGFYDSYPDQAKIIVTGSARLDIFKRGGDSLMGRYFHYRCHPLSIAEIADPEITPQTVLKEKPDPISEEQFQTLLQYGGFPDLFLKRNIRFSNRWKNLRLQQLFREDIKDLTRIQEIGQMEVLAELLRSQCGQLVSYDTFAKKVGVSSPTIRNWLKTLKSFYYCFEVRPFSKNISRALLKEPKYYLWDWSFCSDEGSRAENFIASHLLKAVHFWTDYGFGNFELYFIRDKEKREVDFVIVKDGAPWILIETKNSTNKGISSALYHFQKETGAPFAFQVVLNLPYVNKSCFESQNSPLIVPARTFLSQLI